jgi:hypothetical protein
MSRRLALRHRLFPPALAVVLLGAIWAYGRLRGEPFREASVDEVAALLGRPDVLVVDANATEVFEQAHLPGAVHVNAVRFTAAQLPADRGATLVFYCKNPH